MDIQLHRCFNESYTRTYILFIDEVLHTHTTHVCCVYHDSRMFRQRYLRRYTDRRRRVFISVARSTGVAVSVLYYVIVRALAQFSAFFIEICSVEDPAFFFLRLGFTCSRYRLNKNVFNEYNNRSSRFYVVLP